MSDERHTPDNPTAADDQALGEALGSAIRGRVDTPAARPPVSSIAERAAARAKARNTRRAVVGIAASVALVAGGITAWNTLENDQPTEIIVVDDPAGSPVPEPSAEPAPVDDSSPPPQTGPDDGTDPAVPESVSIGSALEWTEFDPEVVFGIDRPVLEGLESVGNGQVIARGWSLPEPSNSSGTVVSQGHVLITGNGTDWTAIPMPADFTPERLDFGGDRWLVTGSRYNETSSATQAFFSDDQGTTWTDLDIAFPSETSRIAVATVSGQNMVLAVESRIHADIAAVIVARGLAPDKESIKGWMGVEGNTVSFTRDESSSPESFELTAEEEDFLYGGDRSFVSIFHSDGEAVELVAEYSGWDVAGYGATAGFHLLMLANEGVLELTSPDGRQWSQSPLSTGDGTPVDRLFNYYGSTNETVWTSGGAAGEYRVERAGGVYTTPLAAELPEGIAHVNRFSVGPSGVAMVAVPGNSPDADLKLDLRVTKDGYELRYAEPKGGFTLWDLTEDAAVYVFDAEGEQSNMLPEGIRVVEEGDGASELLVFEDPDTGEHLVSFTREELEPWANAESFLAPPDIRPQRVEAWVGWSADGNNWVWQTLSEAFGLTDLSDVEKEHVNVELAVGRDFVIARVQSYQVDPSDSTNEDGLMLTGESPRWFIATVQ